jgi:hypothetical protein
MAKRPIVEVDEEYLLEIMAGSVTRQRKKEPDVPTKQSASASRTEQPVKEETEVTVIRQNETAEPDKTAKSIRKKHEMQTYEDVFLQRRARVPRRQTYISSELYDKINSFLPVLTRGLSFTVYLDNILIHHLERYREDINELYENKYRKPF